MHTRSICTHGVVIPHSLVAAPPPPPSLLHLQASEEQVSQLTAQLESQKAELEAAAAAKLEEAEASFSKQLAEMQTLLADYQTQVGVGCRVGLWEGRGCYAVKSGSGDPGQLMAWQFC